MLDGCRCGNVVAAVTGCLVYRGAKLSAEAHDSMMVSCWSLVGLRALCSGGLQVRHPLLDPQRFGRSTTKPGPPMKSLRLGRYLCQCRVFLREHLRVSCSVAMQGDSGDQKVRGS